MTPTLYTHSVRDLLDALFQPGVPRSLRAAVSETLDRIEAGEADGTAPGVDGLRATRVEIEAPELWVYWRLVREGREVVDLGPVPEPPDGGGEEEPC